MDKIAANPINTGNPNPINFINEIISLYGRETLDEIRVLEKFRVKIKRRVTDLEFLKKYRDENVLPKFTQIKHSIKNKWNRVAFSRLGLPIVRGEIRKNRCILEHLSKNALKLHLKLA
jgi:hypothetical protein